jgi:hypothetical protein
MCSVVEPLKSVTIFVKGQNQDVSLYDRDDQCMKTIVASFEILNTKGTGYCSGGPQIVLQLRDISIGVKYVKEDGTEIDQKGDREGDIVAMAVESVLKHLSKAGCVGKDVVTYQSRRGSHHTGDIEVSDIFSIVLNPDAKASFSLNFREGIVSRTYAYLTERRACIFLNDLKPDILKRMDDVLSKLFPRKLINEDTEKKQD